MINPKNTSFFFLRNWCFFVVNDDSDKVFGKNGVWGDARAWLWGRKCGCVRAWSLERDLQQLACLVIGARLADVWVLVIGARLATVRVLGHRGETCGRGVIAPYLKGTFFRY